MAETTYCLRHPDTPTRLRCNRCNDLICPQCLVHSPVGVRCPDCGQGVQLPVYDVPAPLLTRAIMASVLIGIGGGLALSLIVRPLLFGILYLAAMGGFGYLLAEGVSVAANRKQGRALQFVAVGGVLVALAVVVSLVLFFVGTIDLFDLLGAGLAVYVAFIRLR